MRIKDNFHTHIYLCKHANGNTENYVKKAINLGYEAIGISDHGPILEHYKEKFYSRRMNFDEYHNIYLKEINEAKEVFSNQITVLGALEIEYYDDMTDIYLKSLQDLDYLILGQHNIQLPNGSYKTVYQCDSLRDLELYTQRVIKGLNSGFFSILAHPDIFMMFYQKWDEHAINASKQIIETAIKNNVLLELNANGIRKGFITTFEGIRTYKYPRIEFWELVAKYKEAKIIVSDDAHEVHHLNDEATQKAYEMAEKLNLNIEEKFVEKIKK
jgi:histidinol-phosphatase (PHP family)